MIEPSRVLTALVQALSTMSLYQPGHPARAKAVQGAFTHLRHLLAKHDRPRFSFLGDHVLFGRSPLRDLRDWEWGHRLGDAGVQWVEFGPGTTNEDLRVFLEEVLERMGGRAPAENTTERAIRYGTVGLRDGDSLALEAPLPTATIAYSLDEEAQTMRWVHDEVARTGDVPVLEAEAVVRALAVALHGGSAAMAPLLRLQDVNDYATAHAINVSLLAMSLAEQRGLGAGDVRAIGVAGLLHDVGMAAVPREVLMKPAALSGIEWALVRQHPIHGARILLAREKELALPAIVAHEHHMLANGSGYPEVRFPRERHFVTRLVQICDVYDALRSNRPQRVAWDGDRALRYLEDGAGPMFDAELVRPFARMMRQWESTVAEAEGVPVELDF